jgi:hypothetical protein
MHELRGQPNLAQELPPSYIMDQVRPQHLQCNAAIVTTVRGEEHDGRSPPADLAFDGVTVIDCTGRTC